MSHSSAKSPPSLAAPADTAPASVSLTLVSADADTPSSDDLALVERIRGGDERAFEELFRTYFGPLCDFVERYVSSPAAAEEVVQDVLFRVWEHRVTWGVTHTVAAYLYGAARNAALNRVAHERVERRHAERARRDPLVPDSVANTGADRVVQLELAAAVRRAVDRLPERCRLAFMLSRDHQLSYAEIAAVMGTSVRTVEVQIGRALSVLRRDLLPAER